MAVVQDHDLLDLGLGIPRSGASRFPALKRVFDALVAGVCLVLLGPLMLVIGALVFIDEPGPIFFTQERFTRGRRTFRILKFRTMRRGVGSAEPVHLAQTSRDDPRVTPLGRFLRCTSLDELPQLLNVLRGEMSLVGPRAHATNMTVESARYDELFPGYHERHVVRPGITGWAQVNGNRGSVETIEKARDRLEKDLFYVDHASLWLDVKILLLTGPRLIIDREAF